MPKQRQPPSPYAIEVKTLRDQGYSLQAIGDKFGVSKQAVASLLLWHFKDTQRGALVPRSELADMIGVHYATLAKLENRGVLIPLRRSMQYLYDSSKIDELRATVRENMKRHAGFNIELVCETCGIRFEKRSHTIRPNIPGRFCSNKCKGVWVGKTYGFQKGHPDYKKRKAIE